MVSKDFKPQNRKLYDNLTTNEKDFGIAEECQPLGWHSLFVYVPVN